MQFCRICICYDLTRQVMVYARQQPEAFSERTGKPDIRGARMGSSAAR